MMTSDYKMLLWIFMVLPENESLLFLMSLMLFRYIKVMKVIIGMFSKIKATEHPVITFRCTVYISL